MFLFCPARSLRGRPALRAAARPGWRRRRWGFLSCAQQRALASTLLGGTWQAPPQPGSAGQPTLREVVELAEPMLLPLLPLRAVQPHHSGKRRTPFFGGRKKARKTKIRVPVQLLAADQGGSGWRELPPRAGGWEPCMAPAMYGVPSSVAARVLCRLTYWFDWLRNPRVAARWVRCRFRDNICKVASNATG